VSLALRAAEVGGPLRWRWLLSDAETGVPVADHRVDLDAESADLAAFRAVTGSAGSAVSLVTPGVFGVRAAGLRLAVPRGSPQLDPAGLGPGVLVLPVHALPLAEAVALARELPNLRALLHAADDPAGPVRADADADADRERVRRVRLDTQLAAAEAAAAGEGPDAFFRDGTSTLDPGQFLTALSGWTTRALAVLPPAARLPSP
jgi:hypothetical protein